MIVLLIYFSFLFFIFLKNSSVALLLIIIQIFSVGGSFFLGRSLVIETLDDYSIILMMMILISLIVIPWKNYYNIKQIVPINEKKLKIITRFLIAVNSYSFIILFIIAVIVQTSVQDVNEFKYISGVSEDFIASNLPFPNVFFTVAIIFSNFSYLILPLHFYYLYKKNYKLSFLCLLLSTNIMLVGLTYFSRASVITFFFMYIGILPIFYGLIDKSVKRKIRNVFIIFGVAFFVYFVNITVRRFGNNTELSNSYGKMIPTQAISQDPVTYSLIDYMSQGYLNGYEVLQMYEGEGFNGALTFERTNSLFSTPNENYERLKYRQKLWPYHYSYSFTGFPAYAIYDYGMFGSLIFCLIYFFVVRNRRPRNNVIKFKNIFLLVFLVQVPMMAIFYSEFTQYILGLIILIPFQLYISAKSIKR